MHEVIHCSIASELVLYIIFYSPLRIRVQPVEPWLGQVYYKGPPLCHEKGSVLLDLQGSLGLLNKHTLLTLLKTFFDIV